MGATRWFRWGAAIVLAAVASMGWAPVTARSAAAATADGRTVWPAEGSPDHGSTGRRLLNAPLIDLVATPGGDGYWLLAQDGGVFTHGAARFLGSTGQLRLNQPVVAMAATRTGGGYLFVAADGGVFTFGDATFHGSVPGRLPKGARLNQPIVGVVLTPSNRGYWMVAADGGVFSFGDATFIGSLGGRTLPEPIESFVPTRTGRGYWMVDRTGRTYPFGDAPAVGDLTQARFAEGGVFSQVYGDDLVADAVALPDGNGLVGVSISGQVLVAPLEAASTLPTLTGVRLGPGQHVAALDMPRSDRLWAASTGYHIPRARSGGQYAFIGPGPARWSPCQTITWRFNPAYAPAGGLALVTEVVDYLAAVTGFRLVYGGTTSARPVANEVRGTIVIGWHPDAPSGGWARPIQRGGWIVAGSVELNARQAGDAGGLATAHGPGTFGSVLLHELGHVFGLDHVPSEFELMGNGLYGALGRGDLAGLAQVGGRRGC